LERFAHNPNNHGIKHPLRTHLTSVADLIAILKEKIFVLRDNSQAYYRIWANTATCFNAGLKAKSQVWITGQSLGVLIAVLIAVSFMFIDGASSLRA